MVGFSRGGLQGLLTFQDLPVTSYTIWGGVSDIDLMYEERVDLRGMLRRMIGHPKKDRAAYEARQAIPNINENSPPILIVHGGKDQQVGIHHAYYLADQLELKVPRMKHFIKWQKDMPRPPAMVETLTYIKEFMKQVELHS